MQEYHFTSGGGEKKKGLLENGQMKQERKLNIHAEQTLKRF